MSAAQPFGRRNVLALVGIGAGAFLVLLYAIGTGFTGGSGNDGGGHALSRGLSGYAALATMSEEAGIAFETARDPSTLQAPGLLVLTPPHDAEGLEIERIVSARRRSGPTLVVIPKWRVVPAGSPGAAKPGWVQLAGAASPTWEGFADDVSVDIDNSPRWRGAGRTGPLAVSGAVQSGRGPKLVPLIRSEDGKQILAAFVADRGSYPALERLAGTAGDIGGDDEELQPLIFVFEPDLLDNYGLADRATALGALALLRAANAESGGSVRFDVTLNGLGRARNLLTLAFTPPYLAATLALLMAALAAAWGAFNRFGPPRATARSLAYGKTALVENSAGLIRRARRLRLLGAPYAALVTARLARALGLPANAGAEAIDTAQARRALGGAKYSEAAGALAAARKPHLLVRDAGALRAIEKALTS